MEAVGVDNLLRLVENVGHVDTNDLLGTGLSSEHGEDTGTTADLPSELSMSDTYIKNDLVLEEVLVLEDGVAVGQGADLVLEHLLVDTKVGIRVGVAELVSARAASYSLVLRGHLLGTEDGAVGSCGSGHFREESMSGCRRRSLSISL